MNRSAVVSTIIALIATGSAAAQSTGMPSFNAPYRAFTHHEFGGTLSFPAGPGLAIEGQYRFGYREFDIGFRAGIFDPDDKTRVIIGVEARQRVISHSEDFPLDGALVVGLGGRFVSDPPGSSLWIPAGLSLGRRLDVEDSQVSIVPYAQPTVYLVANGDTRLLFTLGMGADFRLSRTFDARVSIGLGDLEGVALSAVWIR